MLLTINEQNENVGTNIFEIWYCRRQQKWGNFLSTVYIFPQHKKMKEKIEKKS